MNIDGDYQRQMADDEAKGAEACQRAAAVARLTAKQADECDDGEHLCPYCPWRNGLTHPVEGDRFTLANGKEIEVFIVNRHHTVEPVIEYEFVRWTTLSGGRKSYRRKLRDWPRVVAGAVQIRQGYSPHKFYDRSRYEERFAAFNSANAKFLRSAGTAKGGA